MNLINFNKVQAAFLGLRSQVKEHISIPEPTFGCGDNDKGLYVQTGNRMYFITDPNTIEKMSGKYYVTDEAPIFFKEVDVIFMGPKDKCAEALHVPYTDEYEYISSDFDTEGLYIQSGTFLYFISDTNTITGIKSSFGMGE
jgi:hypothetical protein